MHVIATAVGFHSPTARLLQPGDEFEMPDGAKGTWFEPVESAPAPKAGKKKEPATAKTLSQAADGQAQTTVDDMA